MDFVLCVGENGESLRYETMGELFDELHSQIAGWNAYQSDKPLAIMIYKQESNTSTLGVHVTETIETADIFGRR